MPVTTKPKSIVAFENQMRGAGLTHEGPAIGVLHLGYIADGDGAVPFERDVVIQPDLIPKGTKVIELVSIDAVLVFEDAKGIPIDVPLSAIEKWAWCSKNAANEWYMRIHVEFLSNSVKFRWWIGMNQSFFFFG